MVERADAPMVGKPCAKAPEQGPHVFHFSGYASEWHAWDHQAECIHCGITPAGGKPANARLAERCADLIIDEDVGAPVSPEQRSRMIQRIMGALQIASAGG